METQQETWQNMKGNFSKTQLKNWWKKPSFANEIWDTN
ncbi:MAG: hypothetical protein RIR56_474 [Bacteroidota bacterium]